MAESNTKPPFVHEVKKGQVVLIYKDKVIITQMLAVADARYFTACGCFIGSREEVNSKIKELNLTDKTV